MGRARLIAAALALASCAGPAVPQHAPAVPPQCQPRGTMLEHLAAKYGERVIGVGVDNRGAVVELVAGEETWTLLLSGARGVSCMIAAGENWQTVPQPRTGL